MSGERGAVLNQFDEFLALLCGSFDNREQKEAMESKGILNFPYAEHVNTPCNDKIMGLPNGFSGEFVVEESYYTTNGKTHASLHLFLFTPEEEGIKLTSYLLPEGYEKEGFRYERMAPVAYTSLRISEKFTPVVYRKKDGIWEGGSVSRFSPVLTFTLFERFSSEGLEVSETMEVRGKRTFGYDDPIIYRRKQTE